VVAVVSFVGGRGRQSVDDAVGSQSTIAVGSQSTIAVGGVAVPTPVWYRDRASAWKPAIVQDSGGFEAGD